MTDSEADGGSQILPQHFAKIDAPEGVWANGESPGDKAMIDLRQQIEPWLCALLQSEHLSLLVGTGLPRAVCSLADAQAASMASGAFGSEFGKFIEAEAVRSAGVTHRGSPNIEDRIRAAVQLWDGLRLVNKEKADALKKELDTQLNGLLMSVLQSEAAFRGKVTATHPDERHAAVSVLVSFLLSFASRAGTRDRLNLYTTNYDRFIEYGCDHAGIRTIDRFVGTLEPVFRASRLNVDLHYNPPGIRGEPRYLEGVVRLTKLHGSLDWRADGSRVYRCLLPFGAENQHPEIPKNATESLLIYPNPAKDTETLSYPYAELFRDFAAGVCRPNSVLVTYGYGFGDDHINRIIRDMLTIPSTHLVVISYGDEGGRISRICGQVNAAQLTVLLGSHFGDLTNLTRHYLPKPALDTITARKTTVLQKRGYTPPTPAEEKKGEEGKGLEIEL